VQHTSKIPKHARAEVALAPIPKDPALVANAYRVRAAHAEDDGQRERLLRRARDVEAAAKIPHPE
jgi:hypothetical protein